MPIDRAAFTREFTLLLERFGRDPHPLMTQRYFEYLNAHLDTPAFERAARQIFEQDQFWPAPARFVDLARGGSTKELANTAWAEALRLAERGEYPPLEALPAPVRAALKATPLREIAYADNEAKLARLKREFTSAYAAALDAPTDTTPALEAPETTLEPYTDLARFFGAGGDQ